MRPYFINVDFELVASHDLSFLARELNEKIAILVNQKNEDKHYLSFEINSKDPSNPAVIIDDFFEMISSLSDHGKEVIDGCSERTIDLGYNSGSVGWLYNSIPNATLKKITKAGFQLNISVYGQFAPGTDISD